MIVIDERAGVSADDLTPGFGDAGRSSMVWWPIFNYADGYGFTYGIRPAFADPIGHDSMLSFPLSWGGERRAGVELERSFNDQRTRAGVAFWVNRRVNPFFDVPDIRQQVRFEAYHAIVPWMRVGGERAHRAGRVWRRRATTRDTSPEAHTSPSTRASTRCFRAMPFTRDRWEAHLVFEAGSAGRWTTDARGYIGIGPRTVVALRGQLERSDGPCLRPSNRCWAARAAIEPDIASATAWRPSRQRCASRLIRRCACRNSA